MSIEEKAEPDDKINEQEYAWKNGHKNTRTMADEKEEADDNLKSEWYKLLQGINKGHDNN